jgi:high frequency lysogenization protein
MARDGSRDEAAPARELQSILVTNPSRPLEVFGSHLAIRDGYRALVEQLAPDPAARRMPS